jgi:hypothetical protein
MSVEDGRLRLFGEVNEIPPLSGRPVKIHARETHDVESLGAAARRIESGAFVAFGVAQNPGEAVLNGSRLREIPNSQRNGSGLGSIPNEVTLQPQNPSRLGQIVNRIRGRR